MKVFTETMQNHIKDPIQTLNNRVSIRSYTDQPIEDKTVMTLLRAARRAPTSSNTQSYSVVVVRNPETKKQLAVLAGNQKHVETCPVFFALCADMSRMKAAARMHGKEMVVNTETSMVAIIDAALVGMSLCVSAESLGMGTVMIGGMRNKPAEAAALLGLPKGCFIVFGLCIGWINEYPPQKPRMDENTIFHFERYDDSQHEAYLQQYDDDLSEHYRSEGRNSPDAAWTGVMAERFSQPRRPYMREVLAELGITLE